MFGINLFGQLIFANSGITTPDAPPIEPPIIPADDIWAEQCPTVNNFSNEAAQGSTWSTQAKNSSGFTGISKNTSTIDKCE